MVKIKMEDSDEIEVLEDTAEITNDKSSSEMFDNKKEDEAFKKQSTNQSGSEMFDNKKDDVEAESEYTAGTSRETGGGSSSLEERGAGDLLMLIPPTSEEARSDRNTIISLVNNKVGMKKALDKLCNKFEIKSLDNLDTYKDSTQEKIKLAIQYADMAENKLSSYVEFLKNDKYKEWNEEQGTSGALNSASTSASQQAPLIGGGSGGDTAKFAEKNMKKKVSPEEIGGGSGGDTATFTEKNMKKKGSPEEKEIPPEFETDDETGSEEMFGNKKEYEAYKAEGGEPGGGSSGLGPGDKKVEKRESRRRSKSKVNTAPREVDQARALRKRKIQNQSPSVDSEDDDNSTSEVIFFKILPLKTICLNYSSNALIVQKSSKHLHH